MIYQLVAPFIAEETVGYHPVLEAIKAAFFVDVLSEVAIDDLLIWPVIQQTAFLACLQIEK